MASENQTLNEEKSFLTDGTSRVATLTPRRGNRTITNVGNNFVIIDLTGADITGTLSVPYGAGRILIPKYGTYGLKKRQVTFSFRSLDVTEESQLMYAVGE